MNFTDAIKLVESEFTEGKTFPKFKAGDTINVYYKIREGAKERIQQYQGVCLQRRNANLAETFTVRKISNGVGVERIFPLYSLNIDKIDPNTALQISVVCMEKPCSNNRTAFFAECINVSSGFSGSLYPTLYIFISW
jgi:large subunit ribosomal protein L19